MTAFYTTVHAQSQPAVMYAFVSLMRRTMSVNPQGNGGYFLQSQWAQIHSIQIADLCALGAKDARHAYEVVSSLKIKHYSIFTKVTKITNYLELCSSRYSIPDDDNFFCKKSGERFLFWGWEMCYDS